MTAPQIYPFVVDQTRHGGSGSGQRHGFNMMAGPRWKTDPNAAPQQAPASAPTQVQALAVIRPEIAPPPMRLGELGYGLMAAPQLTADQIKAVQTAAGPVIEAIRTELEGLKLEARTLSPEALRENPDIYKGISDLGLYFTPAEMRTQVITDTKALMVEASRILTGALSSYLTDAQVTALTTVVNDSKDLISYLQQFDISPVTGAKSKLSDDEVKQRLAAIRTAVADTEKMVVSQEAPSVPVAEESGSTIGTIIAIGVLAAVGWYLVDQL
jgi:hypothetical protein